MALSSLVLLLDRGQQGRVLVCALVCLPFAVVYLVGSLRSLRGVALLVIREASVLSL